MSCFLGTQVLKQAVSPGSANPRTAWSAGIGTTVARGAQAGSCPVTLRATTPGR